MSPEPRLTPSQETVAVRRARESVALRSGAGCGKTLVLARRYVELLPTDGDGPPDLSRLVALTFTDKAALEMAQRVRKLLTNRADHADPQGRKHLRRWLEEIPDARISTIHGFCASLLRTHAVEAGVDPSFAVCGDELFTDSLAQEAAEQTVLEAVEKEDPAAASLLADLPFPRLVEQVRKLLTGRLAADPSEWTDPKAILRRWRGALDSLRDAARRRLVEDESLPREIDALYAISCDDPSDKLLAYRQEQLGLAQTILCEPDAWTAGTFGALNAKPGNIGRPSAWDAPVKDVRDRLKAVVEQVSDFALFAGRLGETDERAAAALAMLARLAADADARYASEKRARGLLDFDDLLIRADRLLAGNPRVRKDLSDEIEQILIDECQDTDALQADLLSKLVFAGKPDGPPPPGRLFVVGDAKQSIYRFRRAQVEVFADLCRRFGPGGREDLDVSFRTHAAGTEFVNHLFAPLMGEDYAPIRAHRKETPPGPSVEILLAEMPDGLHPENAEEAADAQAAATAERIARMVDSGEKIVWDRDAQAWRAVRYGDIAVLFARMTHSLAYERELADRQVPYYVLAGTGFFRQQEVFDLLNALAVVDNPFDDVAFFGVLRSSLFALDDNALMHVAESIRPPFLPALADRLRASSGCGGPKAPGRTGVEGLAAEQDSALAASVELLDGLHAVKDSLGIEPVLARLLEATGYEAVLLAQPQGRRMCGNVRMLMDRALQATADGLALADFIAQMRELTLSETRYEQAAVATEAENVVRLMTIHKAKGLEFPVVFIPDLNMRQRGFTGDLLNRTDWGLTYRLPGDDKENQSLAWRLSRRLEDDDQTAENVRRLYVAATRHEDRLVLMGAYQRDKDGRLAPSNSPLARIDEVLHLAESLDAGRRTVPYGQGREAVVRTVVPAPARRRSRSRSGGERLMEAARDGRDLAEGILRAASGDPPPPRVGPIPATTGRVELAVTALGEFAFCPMMFRWRYELRVPADAARRERSGAGGRRGGDPGRLDAATTGTLLHLCMQWLDFRRPQPAQALVQRALAEMDLSESADAAAVAGDLERMLATFRQQPIWREFASAKEVCRELDFAMTVGPATLAGKIDLLYRGEDGIWRVADYKSDRVGPEGPAAHAERYRFQMSAYAAAAARHLGAPPGESVLYFLRPGAAHRLPVTPTDLDAFRRRAEALAGELVAARQTGQFRRNASSACGFCPYRLLCLRP